MKYVFYYDTMIGRLRIEEENNAIVGVSTENFCSKESFEQKETGLIRTAHLQLEEYLMGNRKEFTIPIRLEGTEFQKKVWKELRKIPYGETRSYGEIAQAVKSPKASRAVGGANHRNPILVIVPCHRVIGANGALVGFGAGLPMKEKLLNLESTAQSRKEG